MRRNPAVSCNDWLCRPALIVNEINALAGVKNSLRFMLRKRLAYAKVRHERKQETNHEERLNHETLSCNRARHEGVLTRAAILGNERYSKANPGTTGRRGIRNV
jgi:hypothetical protein